MSFKRFSLFIFAAIICASLHAQAIITDETTDGHRAVSTDDIVCRTMTDKIVISVSLFATVDNGTDRTLSLCTKLSSASSFEAPNECVMLVRLMDGSMLEFKSFSGSQKSQANVQNVNGMVIRTNDLTLMFAVTEDQLETISRVGVKKIRIAVSPDMYDKEFKKDKVGAAVGSLWTVLKRTLAKPTKSVYDNF